MPTSLKKENTVLSVKGLKKSFGGQVVLDDVSLSINRGEIVLLRGENGSGKTTLVNILTGNLEPDAGEIQLNINGNREEFSWPRQWWKEINPFDRFTPERLVWEGVGRGWQDIRLFERGNGTPAKHIERGEGRRKESNNERPNPLFYFVK